MRNRSQKRKGADKSITRKPVGKEANVPTADEPSKIVIGSNTVSEQKVKVAGPSGQPRSPRGIMRFTYKGKKLQTKPPDAATNSHKTGTGDDYGFGKETTVRRPKQRIIVAPQTLDSPEIDYLDETMLRSSNRSSAAEKDTLLNIPIELGSISSSRSSAIWSPTSFAVDYGEAIYVNLDDITENTVPFYSEKEENHYAKLSTVSQPHLPPRGSQGNSELSFYKQEIIGRRHKSQGRARSRARSSSTNREFDNPANNGERFKSPEKPRDRSSSKSRDIVAIYTGSAAARRLSRERSLSPARIHSHSRGGMKSQNTSKERASRCRDTVSSANNHSNEDAHSHALGKATAPASNGTPRRSHSISNSEIAAENLELWRTTTSKYQINKSKKADQPVTENTSFVTLLEMDSQKNKMIETMLAAANSLRPANIKMMMIAGHIPSNTWASKDELTVKPGAVVTGLYKQSEWLFAMTDDRDVGFVPYSYTKPIKVIGQDAGKLPMKLPPRQLANSTADPSSKAIAGILKTTKSVSKERPRVRTSLDNDSVSSENSSPSVENNQCRKNNRHDLYKADCIVIDADTDTVTKLGPCHEEMGTYCSDSGISDPNSNHSDDIEFLHSPGSFSLAGNTSATYIPIDNKWLSENSSKNSSKPVLLDKKSSTAPLTLNERITGSEGKLLNVSPMTTTQDKTRKHYATTVQLSNMPLGLLGQRLAQQSTTATTNHQANRSSRLSSDVKDRARSSHSTPACLKPDIPKDYNGPRVTVVYDYKVENEDDLEVHASDIVTVLNGEDIEWIWVQRRDGKEGFIPKEYVIPLELSVHGRRRVGINL